MPSIIKEVLGLDRSEYNDEEKELMRQQIRRAEPLLFFGALFLSLFSLALVNDTIDFGQYNKTSAKDLKDFPSKAKYVLIHLTPGITWILMSVYFVIFKRVGSPAVNPLNGYEKVTEATKNNLTNSIEQFLLLAVSQFILIIHLDSKIIINVIPTLSFLFIFGRIAFWFGYPKYRAFGFIVCNFPIVITVGYNFYQFINFYS